MKKDNKKLDFRVKGKEKKEKFDFLMDLLAIGEEVYSARVAKKMSQEDLAKAIGTSQKVISNIENAEVNFGIDLILRISRALNLQIRCGGFASLSQSKDEVVHNYNIVFHSLEDEKEKSSIYLNDNSEDINKEEITKKLIYTQ